MNQPHTIMKLKRKSPTTAIKISSKMLFFCLVLLNVSILLTIIPMHYQILPNSETVKFSPENLQKNNHPHSAKGQSKGTGTSNRPNSNTLQSVPYISNEEFLQKYAAAYNGHLPQPRAQQIPDPSCGTNPDFFDFFRLSKTERSRFHEDKIIYDTFFKNLTVPSAFAPPKLNAKNEKQYPRTAVPKGTYIELGAFDGTTESNTMFFDKCLGWDGLLIEGQPDSYAKVVEHRPNAVKLSFSPSCNEVNQTVPFYNYPMSNNGMEGLAKSYDGKPTIDVPCGPLTPVLLDVFGPNSNISFLSLDVEGAELLVLRTIDFAKVNIDVVMIEVQNTYCPTGNCPQVHEIRQTMALARYTLIGDMLEGSDVYVKRDTNAWDRYHSMKNIRKGFGGMGELARNLNTYPKMSAAGMAHLVAPVQKQNLMP